MVRGGTEWRVMFTFTRSYGAVIPLPKFVEAGSGVACDSFTLLFKNLIAKNTKYNMKRCTLSIINHSSNRITWIFIKYNISYYISSIFCDYYMFQKEIWRRAAHDTATLSVRTVSHELYKSNVNMNNANNTIPAFRINIV